MWTMPRSSAGAEQRDVSVRPVSAQGLRRLEMPEEIAAYYDEHVEADAVHEQLAVREICAPLVATEPGLTEAG